MNILGKMRIFSKDFNGRIAYSTSISNKKEDGTYDNMYINVQIPQNAIINNGEIIDVTKGFIGFYKDKNGLAHIKLIIQEYNSENKNDNEEIIHFDSNDLPF